MNDFRAGYFQFRPLFGQRDTNLRTVLKALDNVRADLVVLPELAFSGYYFRDRPEMKILADDPHRSDVFDALKALCRRRGLHLVTGFAEKSKDKYFNSAALIRPSGQVSVYRKLHLFNEEKKWFDPGDTELKSFRVGDARVGMMICFDWIFPEVSRTLAMKGVHLIAHPSNLVLNYCQNAMVTRCLENGVFAVTANRIGSDRRPHGELKFTGQSQITAPKGKILHRGPKQRPELHIQSIDAELAEDKHMTALNDVFSDRRTEFYAT